MTPDTRPLDQLREEEIMVSTEKADGGRSGDQASPPERAITQERVAAAFEAWQMDDAATDGPWEDGFEGSVRQYGEYLAAGLFKYLERQS